MAKQNFTELAKILSSNVTKAMVDVLANDLGVSTDSLIRLGIGYHPTYAARAFTFPERENGEVTGISVRHLDGKLMIKGSKRGLIHEVCSNGKGEQYESGKHNWDRVGVETGLACPVCGKQDGCLVAARDPSNPAAAVCVHISEGSVKPLLLGHLHILRPEGNVGNMPQNTLPESHLPIIVVEGATDTAAAMDLGFVAVGRPSAEGGMSGLPFLLRGRGVIVVGDNDAGVGVTGMESAHLALSPVCPRVTKVLPPKQFKDLRQWKNQVGLTQQAFLEWVGEYGDSSADPSVLPSHVAYDIAKTWLEREKTSDGLPTVRCYHGQWLQYTDGHYDICDREEFRGQVYNFLNGKTFPKETAKGDVKIVPYEPTRAKVSDIIDALSDWCTISVEPPVWLKDKGCPEPRDLVAFRNGILDINEYVRGRIKFHDPTPALFSYNILPYDFDEDAHSQVWDDFIAEIFDGKENDRIKLLRQWFGYNCVPDMSFEKMLLCTGRPRSGKGTVLNTLAAMLGSKQCVSTSFQTLCTEFGYHPLIGKLSVMLGDAKVPREKQAAAALEKILQVVGNDPVGVRRMYLPYLPQVFLTCRFTVAMNDLPNVPDQANALEPRLNVLYFGNSYVGREDLGLKLRLRKEAEAGKLINFALAGLKDLRLAKKFVMPATARPLIKQLRELTTPVSAFIADCCELPPPGDKYYVIVDQLYEAWVVWCKNSGRHPSVKQQFGRWFTAACPSATTTRVRLGNKRHRIYEGVQLADWVYTEYLNVERIK